MSAADVCDPSHDDMNYKCDCLGNPLWNFQRCAVKVRMTTGVYCHSCTLPLARQTNGARQRCIMSLCSHYKVNISYLSHRLLAAERVIYVNVSLSWSWRAHNKKYKTGVWIQDANYAKQWRCVSNGKSERKPAGKEESHLPGCFFFYFTLQLRTTLYAKFWKMQKRAAPPGRRRICICRRLDWGSSCQAFVFLGRSVCVRVPGRNK